MVSLLLSILFVFVCSSCVLLTPWVVHLGTVFGCFSFLSQNERQPSLATAYVFGSPFFWGGYAFFGYMAIVLAIVFCVALFYSRLTIFDRPSERDNLVLLLLVAHPNVLQVVLILILLRLKNLDTELISARLDP